MLDNIWEIRYRNSRDPVGVESQDWNKQTQIRTAIRSVSGNQSHLFQVSEMWIWSAWLLVPRGRHWNRRGNSRREVKSEPVSTWVQSDSQDLLYSSDLSTLQLYILASMGQLDAFAKFKMVLNRSRMFNIPFKIRRQFKWCVWQEKNSSK